MAGPETAVPKEATVVLAPERSRPSDWIAANWAPLAVAALTLVAFLLRLALVRDSLAGDELFMFNIVHERSLGDALSIVRETEKTPPLFFVIVWAAAKLGDPTIWSRVPSLLCGTALIPMAYLLGLRTVGRVPAVIAAVILTLDPFAIFYATENRSYAAVTLFTALSTLALLVALESNQRRWWLAYGLAVLAVLYTHYVGVFVLIVQALWALWTRRGRIRELLLVHALVVVAFLPWIPSYLVQQSHSSGEARRISDLAPPSVEYFADINARVLIGHPFVRLRDLPGTLAAAVGIGVIVLASLAALVRAWRRRREGLRLSSPITLMTLLAVATPVGIGLLSLPPDFSFMLPRNLSPSLPAAALVVAWLIVSLRGRLAIAGVALLLGVLLVGLPRVFDPDHRRTPYREVARFIDQRAEPGDAVVHHFYYPEGPALRRVLLINFERPHPTFTTPPEGGEDPAWVRAQSGAHVFVVTPLPGFFDQAQHAGPRDGPGGRFVRVDEGRWDGLVDVVVGEYALPGK